MLQKAYDRLRKTLLARPRRSRASRKSDGRAVILFVLPSLSGGGAERVLLTISTQFPEQEFRKVLLLLTDRGEVIRDIPAFDAVERFHASRTIFSVLRLIGYFWRERPDVIFSTLLRSHVAVYLASRFLPVWPTLVFRSPNMPSEYLKSGEWQGFSAKLLCRSYHAADLIVAQTEEMRHQLITEHHLPETLVKVARNPLDLDRVRRLADRDPHKFSPRAELEVVAIGRLHHQKGLDFLLETFSKVIESGRRARLHILGADVENHLKELERLAVALGIRDRVDFLGFQENPYAFIRDADVLAISSRYEGFPNTLQEAIALRTPTVCTRCADGLDTILDGNKNGFLVDFGDTDAFALSLLKAQKIDQFELPEWTNYKLFIDEAVGSRRDT
ncbi:MAG: glycosyltransferase [Rhodobacterales bacterium]